MGGSVQGGQGLGRVIRVAEPVAVVGIEDILIAFDQGSAFKGFGTGDGGTGVQPIVIGGAAIENDQTLGQIQVLQFGDGRLAGAPGADGIVTECADGGIIDVDRAAGGTGGDGIHPGHGIVLAVGIDKFIHACRLAHGQPLGQGLAVFGVGIPDREDGQGVVAETGQGNQRAMMGEPDRVLVGGRDAVSGHVDSDGFGPQIPPAILPTVLAWVVRIEGQLVDDGPFGVGHRV